MKQMDLIYSAKLDIIIVTENMFNFDIYLYKISLYSIISYY